MLKRIKRGALRKFAFVWRAWGLEGHWGLRNITLFVERTFVFQAPLGGSIVSSSLGGQSLAEASKVLITRKPTKGAMKTQKEARSLFEGAEYP